jgi:hypothetical protein
VARRARIRRRRTAAQPASGSRSETGTRVRRFERADGKAPGDPKITGRFMEPAGVEPVATRRGRPDLSCSRETAYSQRLGGHVTLTVTPHGTSLRSVHWARVHPANAGPQNEFTSSTLIPALSLSFGFGPTWIRTSMSRALRNRSRRSMLNRASLPRTRSDTSG